MNLLRIDTGAVLPVSRDEAKLALRIDGTTAEDSLIDDLIAAATELVEDLTWTTIPESTWRLTLGSFPGGLGLVPPSVDPRAIANLPQVAAFPFNNRSDLTLHIPRGPVSEIDSISYVDPAGNTQSLGAWQERAADDDFVIGPATGTAWPTTKAGNLNAVVIVYTAGSTESWPRQIKQAIKMVVTDIYENRGDGGNRTLATGVEARVRQLCVNNSWFRFDIGRNYG